jgi:FlaA1/EpsC-like NDP-sugar epimerase
MGEPVRIIDLAEKMIMLTGLRPYIDIDIQITGLRPGEKLFEELLLDINKNNIKTPNKKIFIDTCEDHKAIEEELQMVFSSFEKLKNKEIKKLIKEIVPTYSPNGDS